MILDFGKNNLDLLRININMKHFILVCLLLLSGCAPKFNQTNYDRMVEVAAITRDHTIVCATADSMHTSFAILRNDTIYAMEDSYGRGDVDIGIMLTSQLDEIDRFILLINQMPVSRVYCDGKVQNINETARLIAKEEGNKLKLS